VIDETHDPRLQSWVTSANGHPDFPIQNLPFGLFSIDGGEPRGGIAIGDMIVDLAALQATGLLSGAADTAAKAAASGPLNGFLGLGREARLALRRQVSALLALASPATSEVEACLIAAARCTLHLPARIGDYTDFYVGIHHAMNIGRQFRPDNPLLPNYKFVPIGYHGRASSVRPSGLPVHRPQGQTKPPDAAEPSFGPSRRLDYELELGIWIGPGNPDGRLIAIDEASAHIAGYCLLNDWSARDIQAWEYQPLGPFLAKNFATTVSAWIVTPEALAPFRSPQAARPEGDPQPLPYLHGADDQASGALDIELEVLLRTEAMRAQGLPPQRIGLSNTQHMYWTPAQLVTHHTCNGCDLNPGDLLGTGTISGPTADSCGSILEATNGGKAPIRLPSGEERRFLEDGDEVILRARGVRTGCAPIGFGECRAVVVPAVSEVKA
jgi:fumarylacetoacetase